MSLPAVPHPAPLCPLCGQPNHCAAVAAGRFDVPCWCSSQRFPATLIARAQAASAASGQPRACICRACAAQAVAQAETIAAAASCRAAADAPAVPDPPPAP